MARHYEDKEKLKAGVGSLGLYGHVLWFAGALFALLGVLADILNASVGLDATSWLLLSVATLLMGNAIFIGWAVSWYLRASDS
jgi:hypothetical protein